MQRSEKYFEVKQGRISDVVALTAIALQVRVTVLWRGGVGLGKSATANAIARSLSLTPVTIYGQRLEPVDVIGLPYIATEQKTMYATPWWVALARQQPCLVFIDELDKAAEDTRRALLELLLAWRVEGESLHPSTRVMGAFNPPECGGRWEISEDVINRVLLVDFPCDIDGWTEGLVLGHFDGLSVQNSSQIPPVDNTTISYTLPQVNFQKLPESARKWNALIGGFIKANPSSLYLFPRDWAGEPFATPRAWVLAVRLLAGLEAAGYGAAKDERLFRLALEGAVGVVATDEFLEWMRKQDLIPPKQLLSNPKLLPNSLSALYLNLYNCAQHVVSNPHLVSMLSGIVSELERRRKLDLLTEFLRLVVSGLRSNGHTDALKQLEGILRGRKIVKFILA